MLTPTRSNANHHPLTTPIHIVAEVQPVAHSRIESYQKLKNCDFVDLFRQLYRVVISRSAVVVRASASDETAG